MYTAPSGPPTNVRATALSPSEIDLEWDGPLNPTPLLYLIKWGDNPGELNKVCINGYYVRCSPTSM